MVNHFYQKLHSITSITKREYKSYFCSSLAYVFLMAFLVISMVFTFRIANWYKLNEASLRIFFDFHAYLYLFFIPAVGMRLWSEEERAHTLELLLTMPVTVWQAVIGKFLAAWLFVATALALSTPLVVTLYWLGDPDTGRVIAGYAGSWLLGGMCLAICSLCSSLTTNQVTSYITGLLVLLLFTVGGMEQLGVEEFLADYLQLSESVVETLVFFSIIPHIEGLARGVLDLRDLVYFMGIMLFGLAATVAILRCRKAAHKFNRVYTFGVIIVLGICTVLGNLIVRDVSWRADLSEDQLYTLSDASKRVVESLASPTRIRFYFSNDSDGVSIQKKALARRIEDLLREYEAYSRGMLRIEIIDPQPGTAGELSAKFDSMEQIEIGPDRKMYMGLSVIYQDRVMTIPVFTEDEEELMELNISRLLLNVQEEMKPTVLFQSALPVKGSKADPNAGRYKDDPEWSIISQMRIDYNLLELPRFAKVIPDSVALVVLVHPESLSEESIFALDQYLMRGGKLLCFLDNFSLMEGRSKGVKTLSSTLSEVSTLFGFSESWGVRYESKFVVADDELKAQVRGSKNPFMLALSSKNMKEEDPIFENVNKLYLPYSGFFEYKKREGLSYENLLMSSSKNMLVKRDQAIDMKRTVANFKSSGQERILGLRVTGKLPSSFKVSYLTEEQKKEFVPEGSAEAEVVLISDADMLHDSFEVNVQKLFDGRRERITISDNTVLFLNLIDQMTRGGKLLGLRGRRIQDRRFTRKKDIQLAELKELQTEIDTEQKIYHQNSAIVRDYEGRMQRQLSLNEAQKIELAEARDLRDKANGKLENIEATLMNSSKQLENRIWYYNLLIPPAAILLILMLHWVGDFRNRRKQR